MAVTPALQDDKRAPPAGNGATRGDDDAAPAAIRRDFIDHIEYSRGKNPDNATPYDRFLALAQTVRDRLAKKWVKTQRTYYEQDVKRAYYLSAEYLLGRALANNLVNLGLLEATREALRDAGSDFEALCELEP